MPLTFISPPSFSVSFNAPNEQYETFSGSIKVVNSEDSTDYDTIDIVVVTPRNRQILNSIFSNLVERFPVLMNLLNSFNFLK